MADTEIPPCASCDIRGLVYSHDSDPESLSVDLVSHVFPLRQSVCVDAQAGVFALTDARQQTSDIEIWCCICNELRLASAGP